MNLLGSPSGSELRTGFKTVPETTDRRGSRIFVARQRRFPARVGAAKCGFETILLRRININSIAFPNCGLTFARSGLESPGPLLRSPRDGRKDEKSEISESIVRAWRRCRQSLAKFGPLTGATLVLVPAAAWADALPTPAMVGPLTSNPTRSVSMSDRSETSMSAEC